MRIKNREREADVAKISDAFSKQSADTMRAELDVKNQRIAVLEATLFETQKQLDEVVLSRKSEGTAQLQAEHYKVENERLLKMLADTDKYASFSQLLLPPAAEEDEEPKPIVPKKDNKEFSVAEFEDWVPPEAFKVAHDFRNKCALHVSTSMINQLLNKNNKITKEQLEERQSKIRPVVND